MLSLCYQHFYLFIYLLIFFTDNTAVCQQTSVSADNVHGYCQLSRRHTYISFNELSRVGFFFKVMNW